MTAEIIPGILTRDLEEYRDRLAAAERSGARWIHLDVMDGQFVPNVTVLPSEFLSMRTPLHVEVHLMVFRPERYYSDLMLAGCRRVLLHREAYGSMGEAAAALTNAREYFPEAGMAYSPGTSIEDAAELGADAIQIMGVVPGASGQPILGTTYGTIQAVKEQGSRTPIAVDGGAREENLPALAASGATRLVVTSQLFSAWDVKAAFERFTRLAQGSV